MQEGEFTHQQDKNRSLPQSQFCQILGQKFGMNVMPGQIHRMLHRSFGNDASARSLSTLGLLQAGLAVMQVPPSALLVHAWCPPPGGCSTQITVVAWSAQPVFSAGILHICGCIQQRYRYRGVGVRRAIWRLLARVENCS